MHKRTLLIIPVILVLVACSSAVETAERTGNAVETVRVTQVIVSPDTPSSVVAATGPVLTATRPLVTIDPTDTPLVETPTAAVTPTDTPVATDIPAPTEVAYGRTEEGAYYHGAVDAPVTLIDYSDFL